MTKYLKLISMHIALCCLISSSGFSLQNMPLEIAREGASLAGGASFCNANDQDVELYIAQTEGRIAASTPNRDEAILARIEFINLLTAAKAKGPKSGCDEHLRVFNRVLAVQ